MAPEWWLARSTEDGGAPLDHGLVGTPLRHHDASHGKDPPPSTRGGDVARPGRLSVLLVSVLPLLGSYVGRVRRGIVVVADTHEGR